MKEDPDPDRSLSPGAAICCGSDHQGSMDDGYIINRTSDHPVRGFYLAHRNIITKFHHNQGSVLDTALHLSMKNKSLENCV